MIYKNEGKQGRGGHKEGLNWILIWGMNWEINKKSSHKPLDQKRNSVLSFLLWLFFLRWAMWPITSSFIFLSVSLGIFWFMRKIFCVMIRITFFEIRDKCWINCLTDKKKAENTFNTWLKKFQSLLLTFCTCLKQGFSPVTGIKLLASKQTKTGNSVKKKK